MQKKRSSRKAATRPVLGRQQFGKISAVEGIRLSGTMKRAFAEFDRMGLSAEERRQSIIGRFTRAARQKVNV